MADFRRANQRRFNCRLKSIQHCNDTLFALYCGCRAAPIRQTISTGAYQMRRNCITVSMSDNKKHCSTCRAKMEQVIDMIKPETIAGLPADGLTVTGARFARYECSKCHVIELSLKAKGTWTILRNVSIQ
jgi:hypothetical protein